MLKIRMEGSRHTNFIFRSSITSFASCVPSTERHTSGHEASSRLSCTRNGILDMRVVCTTPRRYVSSEITRYSKFRNNAV